MMWEKIREIEHNEYIKYTQVFNVDADIEAMCQDVNSLKEFITLKYTQCVIWDRALNSPDIEDDLEIQRQAIREGTHEGPYALYVTTPQQMFLKRLNELNNAVFSRFWDDSDCDEKIFYYFALLNFKTHQHHNALRLLDKSLKQERTIKVSEQDSVLRLHKRCLRAYCLEYLGLSSSTKKDEPVTEKTALLSEAIKFLVGYDVLSTEDPDDIINEVMENTERNDNLFQIMKMLSKPEQACVFNILEQYHNDGSIGENVYNEYLVEIAHILSHCLSEIRVSMRNDASYQKKLRKSDVLCQKQDQKQAVLLRIAEKLMSILGDDYITCYATLKIENGEYFSSLDVLNTEREKFIGKLNEEIENAVADEEQVNRIKKIQRRIAQIDFYCWYFSIFARKQIAERSKENFLEYSQNTGDPVANTYYNVVNMKEILLKTFEDLRRNGKVSDKDKAKLAEVYEEFKALNLHYSIHTTISDEWDFLKESYLILQLCCDINADQNNANSIELSFYNLYSKLSEIYNCPCDFIPNEPCKDRNKEALFHIFTLSCGGQLVCRGDYSEFLNAAECNNVYFSTYTNKTNANCKDFATNEGTRKILFNLLPKDTSNIVIAVDNNSCEEDLSFIELIVSFDSREKRVDRHNIFVDISSLSKDKKTIFLEKIRKIEDEYPDFSLFCVISNLKSVMLLGCLFSMLEKHLLRLSTPLNSYVISPVDEDMAFDAQSCENLIFLDESNFGNTENIQWGEISDWGYSFGSCFPNKTKMSKNGKVLFLDRIGKCADIIGYIFYFESGENSSVSCHAFDVQSNKSVNNRAYIFSDTIRVESNTKKNISPTYNEDHDIILALSNLYKTSRREHHLRRTESFHSECDKSCECFNLFTFACDSSKDYKVLREYLYSYMGVLLEKSIFLLLRDGSVSNSKRWVLCTLPQESSNNLELQRLLCSKLCDINDYIKDENKANIEHSNILSDSESHLAKLEKQIMPCVRDRNYFFVSYKSKNRTASLCTPVYEDVIYLQNNYNSFFDVAVDVANFTDRFNDEIVNYINNEFCVGAFVYLSYEYMCPMQIDKNGKRKLVPKKQDKCFMEIKLLLERRAKNPDFHIVFIHLSSNSKQIKKGNFSLVDLINSAFKVYWEEHDFERLEKYRELFKLDEVGDSIEAISDEYYCDWKENALHLKSSNIQNALKKYEA